MSDNQESIFAQALQYESDNERASFVSRACANQPALRQEIESLLRAYSKGAFLESPACASSDTLDPPLRHERPDAQIGRYKLLEQIGEGGMGVVYMAEQTEPVRRRVALKIVKPGMDSRQVLARFAAERQALALMDHPNIAKVHDAGTADSGLPFFVMELVRGVPITQNCDQARLTTQKRLELFVAVCHAIVHAHQKGIIHRDLKPSNVLVTLHDGVPVPKVIDFGIAKAVSQQLTDKTLFTAFNQMVGTPLYMSPEQAEMSGLDVDTRSDVYSLGVLLYELLTGHTPFDKEQLAQAGLDEFRRIIREDEPLRPSQRISTIDAQALSTLSLRRGIDERRLGPLLRGELDWIVMKALEKDRTRRYESASALAADVQRYLSNEQVQACPPSVRYRMRKFIARHKGPVIAGVGLATLLILGTIGTSVGLVWALGAEQRASAAATTADQERQTAESERQTAEAQRDRARNAEAHAKEEAAISKAVNEFLRHDLLDQAAPDLNARDKQVTVEELLSRASGRIAGKFKDQPRSEAEIRRSIGNAYRALGILPVAQGHLERALLLYREVLGEAHIDTATAKNDLAGVYSEQGQYAKTETLLVEAIETYGRVLGDEHADTLNSMSNLANVYSYLGNHSRAEALCERILSIRRRLFGDRDFRTLNSMNNLASIYSDQKEYAKSEQLCRQVLDGCREVLGAEHPHTLTAMNNLASKYMHQGDPARAEALFQQALEIGRRVLGDEHPDTVLWMGNLTVFYVKQNNYAKAEELGVEVLDIRRRVLGDDHPHTMIAMNSLARALTEQRKYKQAEELYEQLITIQKRVLGDDHLDTVLSLENLATAVVGQGNWKRAVELAVEALGIRRRVQGDEDPDTLTAMDEVATLYQVRELESAEPYLREIVEITRKLRGDRSPPTSEARLRLGSNLLLQKKYAEAEPVLVAAYEGMSEQESLMPAGKNRLKLTVDRLVQLYDAWGKSDQSAHWRKV